MFRGNQTIQSIAILRFSQKAMHFLELVSYNDLHHFITWVFIGYIGISPMTAVVLPKKIGGGFKYFYFRILQMGWFNHQLENQLTMINHH